MENFSVGRQFDPQLGATTSVLEMDFDVLRDYINRFQQGTWPDPNPVINPEMALEVSCED
jgi:hypothetical protein